MSVIGLSYTRVLNTMPNDDMAVMCCARCKVSGPRNPSSRSESTPNGIESLLPHSSLGIA